MPGLLLTPRVYLKGEPPASLGFSNRFYRILFDLFQDSCIYAREEHNSTCYAVEAEIYYSTSTVPAQKTRVSFELTLCLNLATAGLLFKHTICNTVSDRDRPLFGFSVDFCGGRAPKNLIYCFFLSSRNTTEFAYAYVRVLK